jgi:hypothetical protein
MKSQSLTGKCCQRAHFVGGSDARIIASRDEAPAAALIRPWQEQSAQTKSQKSLSVATRDPRYACAYTAKSSPAQASRLQPIGRKYSRAGHGQRQTAPNLTAFMTGIGRFMKAYAILWQKLYARFAEHTFDQGNRVLVSRVATHLNIRDRVSMKACCLSQVSNCPIERRTRHPNLRTCHRHDIVPVSHVTVSQPRSPCGRIKGGSSELQID